MNGPGLGTRQAITDLPIARKMFAETGAWTLVWAVVRIYVV